MKKYILYSLLFTSLFSLSGCDYYNSWKYNKKYKGKVFKISTEIKDNAKVGIKTWENANELSYDKEENVYTFYVNGKLVDIDSYRLVIIEEQ